MMRVMLFIIGLFSMAAAADAAFKFLLVNGAIQQIGVTLEWMLALLTMAVIGSAKFEPTVKKGTIKTCPDCAETVKAAANVCRYCHHEFG